MKKIIAIAVLGSVLVFSAFAQVRIGAYAKSWWIPYRLTVPDEGSARHTTAIQSNWGEQNIVAGLNVNADIEYGGLYLKFEAEGGKDPSASAMGWVWARPLFFIPYLDTLKLYAGNVYNETLMGKVGASPLVPYVLNDSWATHFEKRMEYRDSQYNIFTRFNPYDWGQDTDKTKVNLYWPEIKASGMLTIEPIDNLFIGLWVAPIMTGLLGSVVGDREVGEDMINQDYYSAAEVYQRMQVGAGYTMPGIGFARAQWIGVRNVFEMAFQTLFMPDLMLDVGIKIPYEGKNKDNRDTYKRKRDYQVSVGGVYRFSNFRLTGRLDTAFLGSDSTDRLGGEIKVHGLDLILYLMPSYVFEFGTIGADFGFEWEQADDINGYEKDSFKAGMGVWFGRDMGNVKFKSGFTARLPLNGFDMNRGGVVKTNFDFFIPVFIEVGF